MCAEVLGNNERKNALNDLGSVMTKFRIMQLGNTNLRNTTEEDIKYLTKSINEIFIEIESAHSNDRAEVCVAVQFLKDTV